VPTASLRRWRTPTFLILLVAAVLVAACAAASVQQASPLGDRVVSGSGIETGISTPDYGEPYGPVVSATDAVSRALQRFPIDHRSSTPAVAKLLPYHAVNDWRGASSPGVSDDDPAWLVGIAGIDLTAADVMTGVIPVAITPSSPAATIEGAFYVLDARTGQLTGVGVLSVGGSRSMASLGQLVDVPMPVLPATSLPPVPTLAPTVPGAPTATPW
jgi:hypothetical protein